MFMILNTGSGCVLVIHTDVCLLIKSKNPRGILANMQYIL